MALITFVIFAVASALDWVAVRGGGSKTLEYVAKPAALAALLLFACTGEDPSWWLVAALSLSLLGDVYLMLPGDLFLAGLSAFLLAHLAYIAELGPEGSRHVLWLVVVAAVLHRVVLRIVRAAPEGPLRAGVAAYVGVISIMLAAALASGRPLAIVGAALFCASDAMIGWNRFVRPLADGHLYIMVTYHLGQLGLVLALRNG